MGLIMVVLIEHISNETPTLGDFVCINGGETLGLVVGLGPNEFIKAASVRKNGRRQTAYYLPEVLTMPEPSIAGMVRFYDTCTGFYDGSAGAEGEAVGLIERIRDRVLDLSLAVGQAVHELDGPHNRDRIRVCLDYATRSGMSAENVERERVRLLVSGLAS
jgi:hypothetical protein